MASKRTILLVEDDTSIRRFVADLLIEEGYSVIEASNGYAAIKSLDSRIDTAEICLVLLDMNLPGIDGAGILRHLNCLDTYVPVIAMSASAPALLAAQTAGVQATIPKPFELDHLLEVIARHCGGDS